MNVYKFPYDSHTCPIVIGSWTLDISEIEMNYDEFTSASGFVENSIWALESENNFVQNTTRLDKEYLASDLYFQLTMKRKPMYYIVNNVYPCLILNLITLFTYTFQFQSQVTLSKHYHILIYKLILLIFTILSFNHIPKYGNNISEISWRHAINFRLHAINIFVFLFESFIHICIIYVVLSM